MNAIKRFEDKIMYEPNTGCWIWTSAVNTWGYGQFCFNRKAHSAHRFSYKLYRGEIPNGLHVCHHCDNRLCVNPDHFFLGTALDNALDKVRKGRCSSGQRHGMSKLTDREVDEIRELYKNNFKQTYIAQFYEVSIANIYYIVNNKSRIK